MSPDSHDVSDSIIDSIITEDDETTGEALPGEVSLPPLASQLEIVKPVKLPKVGKAPLAPRVLPPLPKRKPPEPEQPAKTDTSPVSPDKKTTGSLRKSNKRNRKNLLKGKVARKRTRVGMTRRAAKMRSKKRTAK